MARGKTSYPVALNQHGRLVFVSETTEADTFTCPGCTKSLYAKRGRVRVHHFSHAAGTMCPAPETALHRATKFLIAEGFTAAVAANRPYHFVLPRCTICHRQHRLPVPGEVIRQEAVLPGGTVRPDLVTYDAGGKAAAVIEVVVTHAPDEPAKRFYEAWPQLALFHKADWDELAQLRDHLPVRLVARLETLCPQAQEAQERWRQQQIEKDKVFPQDRLADGSCPRCQTKLGSPLRLIVYENYNCWKCGRLIRVADRDPWGKLPCYQDLEDLAWQLWKVNLQEIRRDHYFGAFPQNICRFCGTPQRDKNLGGKQIFNRTLQTCHPCERWYIGPTQEASYLDRMRAALYGEWKVLTQRPQRAHLDALLNQSSGADDAPPE